MGRTASFLVIAAMSVIGGIAGTQAQATSDERPQAPVETGNTREAAARRSFEEGRTALEWGSYEDALRSFERAYDLSGRSEMLFNIGTVLDRLGRSADAVRYFERYLDVQPDAFNRAAVEDRVAQLRTRIKAERAAPEASVPPPREVARAHVEPAATPSPTNPAREQTNDDENTPLRKKWWFWTGLAAVAAGGAVAAVLLTRDREQVQEPLVGSQDAFIQALTSR